jgi:hypothetical protein
MLQKIVTGELHHRSMLLEDDAGTDTSFAITHPDYEPTFDIEPYLAADNDTAIKPLTCVAQVRVLCLTGRALMRIILQELVRDAGTALMQHTLVALYKFCLDHMLVCCYQDDPGALHFSLAAWFVRCRPHWWLPRWVCTPSTG